MVAINLSRASSPRTPARKSQLPGTSSAHGRSKKFYRRAWTVCGVGFVEVQAMKVSQIIILWLALVISCVSSIAQYVRPTTGGTMREFNFNNPMSALAATMVMNRAREDALAKRLGANPNSASSANQVSSQPQPVNPADESSLKFRSAGGYIKTRELADQLG